MGGKQLSTGNNGVGREQLQTYRTSKPVGHRHLLTEANQSARSVEETDSFNKRQEVLASGSWCTILYLVPLP